MKLKSRLRQLSLKSQLGGEHLSNTKSILLLLLEVIHMMVQVTPILGTNLIKCP